MIESNISELKQQSKLDVWLIRMIDMGASLVGIQLSERVISSIVQFVKFGIVGVTNTLISYFLNILALRLMEPYHISKDYVLANLFAFVLSVLWSFYWNSRFVFTADKGKRRVLPTLMKTYIAYGFTGIILTNVLSFIWIDVFQISKYIAPLINLAVSVPINFIINKMWAFK